MTTDRLLALLDLGLLTWIALMERSSLKLEQQNHLLYKDFFNQRSKWYAARNKTKPPELPGGQMADVLVEDSSTDE